MEPLTITRGRTIRPYHFSRKGMNMNAMNYEQLEAISAMKRKAAQARELADKLDQYAKDLEDDSKVDLHTRFE